MYAQRAFGPRLGLVAGTAQWIEFVFAPPAIAFAIGSYFSNFTQRPTPVSTRRRGLSDLHGSQHVGSQTISDFRIGDYDSSRWRAFDFRWGHRTGV